MLSSITYYHAFDDKFHSNKDINKFHIYIKLDGIYNVEEIYKHYLTGQLICSGHLTFMSNSGYNNIRVSPKFNVENSNIYIKIDYNIYPIISNIKGKIIKHEAYDRFRSYKENDFDRKILNKFEQTE